MTKQPTEAGERERLARRLEEWAKADRIPPSGILRRAANLLRTEPVARIQVKDGTIEEVKKIGPTPPDGEYLIIPAPR